MSCRRSRIIIKPNIRPSVARSGPAAAKAKPAAASSAGAPTSATAANSGGSESGHVKATTTPAADKDTDETANTVVSGSEAVTVEVKAVPTSKNDVGSIPDTSAEKDGMGNHGESIVSDSGVGSSLSQSEQTEESSLGVEPRGGSAVSESGDGVSDVGPSLQLSEKPLEEPGREDIGAQPAQTAGLSTPVAELPSVSSPVTPQDAPFVPPLVTSSLSKDGKVVVSVEGDMSVAMEEEVTPSEADTSCMSEAVSLEPTEERRGELEEDVEVKKPRRRRMRKPCTELLQSREKSPDRQKMKMSDLLSWNPQQNFFPKKKKKPSVKNETSSTAAHVTISVDDDAESSNQSASLPAPQVMIGPDGNIILNTESLLIHTEKVETGSPKEVIEEDDDDRYLNTNSYRTTKNAKLWTEKETEKFFLGLSMCGTDFSLLTRLMPHRSRRDLKNKFRREERRNRPLIDSALANRQKYDPAPFERLLETVNSKVKQEAKKAVKKEKEPRKAQKRKKPKKKEADSEEDEDVWNPDEDDDVINGEDSTEAMAKYPYIKRKKTTVGGVKSERANPTSVTGVPGPSSGADKQVNYVTQEAPPKMRPGRTKTYSKTAPVSQPPASAPAVPASGSANLRRDSSLQDIPGSVQIQIEMADGQSAAQGVLIPSNMVPIIAPQLGIQNATAGMQVLLVQEETSSGSMVHVYIIPEGEALAARGAAGDSTVTTTLPAPPPPPAGAPRVTSPAASSTASSSQASAVSGQLPPSPLPTAGVGVARHMVASSSSASLLSSGHNYASKGVSLTLPNEASHPSTAPHSTAGVHPATVPRPAAVQNFSTTSVSPLLRQSTATSASTLVSPPVQQPLPPWQPTMAPMSAQVRQPTIAPMSAQVRQPTMAPMSAQVRQPTIAPISIQVRQPTVAPMSIQVRQPTVAPMSIQVRQPTVAPMSTQVRQPTVAPVQAIVPTPAPQISPIPHPTPMPMSSLVPEPTFTPQLQQTPQQTVTPSQPGIVTQLQPALTVQPVLDAQPTVEIVGQSSRREVDVNKNQTSIPTRPQSSSTTDDVRQ